MYTILKGKVLVLISNRKGKTNECKDREFFEKYQNNPKFFD